MTYPKEMLSLLFMWILKSERTWSFPVKYGCFILLSPKLLLWRNVSFSLNLTAATWNSTHGVTCSKYCSIYCVAITRNAAVRIFDINKCKLSNGEVLSNLFKFIFSFCSCFVATEVSFCNCDIFSSVSCAVWQWNKSHATAGTEQTFFLPFSNGKLA